MRLVPVTAPASVPAELVSRLAADLGGLRTLADILHWADRQIPRRRVSEIVTQDEFTHDVVLPFDGSHFLVFDATWLGSITAVAVWDHEPSAPALLAARLERGWMPIPSRLRDGDRVLGYAACVVTREHRATIE